MNQQMEPKIKIEKEYIPDYASGSKRQFTSISPTHPESTLRPATGGRGLRLEVDDEERKRFEEEAKSYLPFSKRLRTGEENYGYVEEFKLNEIEKISSLRINVASTTNNPIVKNELLDPIETLFYNNPNYNFFNHQYDSNLPIISLKDEITNTLKTNNIVIIQGNTGCGKTTQVPQFILDDSAKSSLPCKIIVTQPRRIAAKSISKRVCDERNWHWGSVCGFKVSMEKRVSDDTRIFYVTTGYLLELIVADHRELEKYTHIVLDEIHERDTDNDLVILLVKILLRKNYQGKIILMSATLDAIPLVEYFSPVSITNNVPVIRCNSSVFSVKTYYLNDLEKILNYQVKIDFKIENPCIFDEQLNLVTLLLQYIDKKEVENMPEGVETINNLADVRGAVLIFVPGMEEINRVQQHLMRSLPDNRITYCQLHRDIALDQQMRAFDSSLGGYRKIIISTSIAESSVTVPDIKYVIDFCLTKSPYTDPGTNFTSLEVEWTSKANMRQRRGRAGRVNLGICYRLIPESFYKYKISEFSQPTIERESLDKLILNIKRFCKEPPKEILAMALTPPALDKIERTVLFLKEAGALSLYKNKRICATDGDLTYAGSIIANLPCDIKLGKLILIGHAFGRLREAVILAAGLSCKNIFRKYHGASFEYYKVKFFFANGLLSDFTCIINAYNLWKAHEKYSQFTKDEMKNWCEKNMLEFDRLKELEKNKREIENRLQKFNLIVEEDIRDIRNECFSSGQITDEQTAIDECYLLKFMIAGAFYPNYFKTTNSDERQMVKTLNGKDPRSTVVVSGFNKSAVLFHNKLKEIFKICGKNLILHYEGKKAFVEFKDFYEITNKIATGVYFSAILNKLDLPILLPYPNEIKAEEIEKEITHLKNLEGQKYGTGVTSRLTTGTLDSAEDASLLLKNLNEFRIKIVVISDLNYFWAQIDEDSHKRSLDYINSTLNNQNYNLKRLNKSDLFVGKLVASFHFTGVEFECGYYRAKITRIEEDAVHIIYVDYGNTEEKDFDLIFELSEELCKFPHQAFQCELAHLKVDPFIRGNADKMEKAIDEFSNLLKTVNNLKARVYSIVENIVRILLIDGDNPLFEYDISLKLIKIGLFEKSEESYMSKLRHDERMNRKFLEGYDGTKSKNEWINIQNIERLIADLDFSRHKDDKFKVTIFTPIEVRVHGMTRCTRICRVRHDRESINYALLDEEPNVHCSSLVVAYNKKSLKDRDDLILSTTCLFPKIKGLVSLCLLAFAPEAEFRFDEKTQKYTGALCGLGFDHDLRKPLYTENDIEDVFEVEFTDRDISFINSFRTILNCIIGSKKGSQLLLDDSDKLKKFQKDCRKSILELLKEKRKLIENPQHFNRELKWNQINENYLKALSVQDKRLIESRKTDSVFYMPLRGVNFAKLRNKNNESNQF